MRIRNLEKWACAGEGNKFCTLIQNLFLVETKRKCYCKCMT